MPACSADPNTFGIHGKELTFSVADVTGRESEYSLEKHGFVYVQHASELTEMDYDDHEKVKAVYYPETAELLKKM
jgi:hypothetical protein